MNVEKQTRLNLLKEEQIIWIISIFLTSGALLSSILETEDVKNDNNNYRDTYRTINIIVFIITLLINLYFVNLSYYDYLKKKDKRILLNLIGSIFASIGIFLFLIAEIIIISQEKKE